MFEEKFQGTNLEYRFRLSSVVWFQAQDFAALLGPLLGGGGGAGGGGIGVFVRAVSHIFTFCITVYNCVF